MEIHQNRVPLLEDEPLISWDIEFQLENAGYLCSSIERCSVAVEWLQQNTPCVAILEISVMDGSTMEVANVLEKRSVPSVVYTGDDNETAVRFTKGRIFLKPYEPTLIAACNHAVAQWHVSS